MDAFSYALAAIFCLDYRNAQLNHENFLFSPSEALYNATLGTLFLLCCTGTSVPSLDWKL